MPAIKCWQFPQYQHAHPHPKPHPCSLAPICHPHHPHQSTQHHRPAAKRTSHRLRGGQQGGPGWVERLAVSLGQNLQHRQHAQPHPAGLHLQWPWAATVTGLSADTHCAMWYWRITVCTSQPCACRAEETKPLSTFLSTNSAAASNPRTSSSPRRTSPPPAPSLSLSSESEDSSTLCVLRRLLAALRCPASPLPVAMAPSLCPGCCCCCCCFRGLEGADPPAAGAAALPHTCPPLPVGGAGGTWAASDAALVRREAAPAASPEARRRWGGM